MVVCANKAVVVIWGVLLFNEVTTIGKLLGIAMVMAGIVLYAKSDKTDMKE